MSSNPHNLVVGQVLYYAPYDQRGGSKPRDVVVLSIGRKWAYISDGHDARIDLKTLVRDSGEYSPRGQIYLSQAVYEAEVKMNADWRSFRQQIDVLYSPPAGISHEDIAQIRRLLGIQKGAL